MPRIRGPTIAPDTSSKSREAGDDATATSFEWNVFLLAGNPAEGRFIVDAAELAPGTLTSRDTYYAGYANRAEVSEIHCPDNLGIDPSGRLWIVSDSDTHGNPNNGCFVVPTEGPERGRLRQLASGPVGCEVCGCEFTPDGRTLFLSIQHPGRRRQPREPAQPLARWQRLAGALDAAGHRARGRRDGLTPRPTRISAK